MKEEIVYVDQEKVSCAGDAKQIGHPLVYLSLIPSGHVVCPYCSQEFKLKSE